MNTLQKISTVLCRSGKFETGEGTCAAACMDQLGDPRKFGCSHVTEVHGKLANEIMKVITV